MSLYLTSLDIKDYQIFQDTEDYAFSQDSVFLANMANLDKNDRVLDLGCGCGVLATLALVKKGVKHAVGIELQERVANMARQSAHINNLDNAFDVICGDVKNVRTLVGAESFDKVLCNPPYFANAQHSTVSAKELSRHESTATLDDFICAGAYALKFGGDMWLTIKAERMAECIHSLVCHSLQPKELVLVCPKPSSNIDIVIIKARKGAKVGLQCRTFFVCNEDGTYTNEYKELYN